jgi:hypothetical protein
MALASAAHGGTSHGVPKNVDDFCSGTGRSLFVRYVSFFLEVAEKCPVSPPPR